MTYRTLLYASVFASAIAAPSLAAGLLGGAVGGMLNGSFGGFGTTGAFGTATHIAPAISAQQVRTLQVPAVALPNVSQVTTAVTVHAIPDVEIRRAAIVETGIVPVAYADVPVYVDQQYVVLQHDLAGTGVRVEKQGEQIVLEMPSDVTFAFDKYDIQPRFFGVLNTVSRTLAKYPATYVDVNGHTDAIGSYAYNQVLSERRADSVAVYLADRSVQPARMHVQGFGKTEPIATNATIEGRAANRRVEIILTPYAS
jgi:outer membrane protein OmpA-like peptidoglycan-associated protein